MNVSDAPVHSRSGLLRIEPVDAFLVCLLWMAAVVVLGKDISVGGLRYGDDSAHAMDGVLIHDWVAAGRSAWRHPITFAEQQYAHYPTLGIGRHYPPGFALVEAAFFGVFGISAVTSRLAVLFFGLMLAAGSYVFVRGFSNRLTAVLAGVALITFPATAEWGRQTMLEVPTLAVLSWCAVAFSAYGERPTWTRFLILQLLMTTAVFFRQNAVFLVGAVATVLCIQTVRRRARADHAVIELIVASTVTCVVAVTLSGHAASLLHGDLTYPNRWSRDALLGYLEILPASVGVHALALAGLGLIVSRKRVGTHWLFLAAWFCVHYFMLIAADFRYNRYIYLGLFPVGVWAALGASWLLGSATAANVLCFGERREACSTNGRLPLRWGVAVAIAVAACFQAWRIPTPTRPDYGPVVLAHRDEIQGRAVLFHGLREGDFVFAVRQHLPWRSAMVIRGSKLFYTCDGRPNLHFQSLVQSPEALGKVMKEFAFRQVFIERQDRVGVLQSQWLREFLKADGSYRRQAAYALPAESRPCKRDVTLEVYEATTPVARTVDEFEIRIPRLNRSVRVRLTDWPT
jgi:hypothetical protein